MQIQTGTLNFVLLYYSCSKISIRIPIVSKFSISGLTKKNICGISSVKIILNYSVPYQSKNKPRISSVKIILDFSVPYQSKNKPHISSVKILNFSVGTVSKKNGIL